LKEVEKKLAVFNFLGGDQADEEDFKLFSDHKGDDLSKYPNVSRVINIISLMKK